MLQAQTYVYDKNVLAVLRTHIFLVAVVIVGFVRAVCFDASDSSKTNKAVGAVGHIIPFFMPLPYTASLYHVYANHFMPQLSILLNASGGYFMLSYAASSLCEECFALYFILLSAKVFFDTFSITYSTIFNNRFQV